MRIGLYFGSFNPVHVGHLIIANYMVTHAPLDEAWMVVSPQNPLKPSGTLLNEYDRLHLVELGIGGAPGLRASNVEFHLPRPSYTMDTLAYLGEKYPQHRFSVIMGSDSLQNLPRWKNYQRLLEDYPLLVYPRPDHPVQAPAGATVTVYPAPLLDLSSSAIRRMIRQGESIRFMVPDSVYEYIMANRYYAGPVNG